MSVVCIHCKSDPCACEVTAFPAATPATTLEIVHGGSHCQHRAVQVDDNKRIVDCRDCAIGPWALDSGGFTELNLHGTWTLSPADYVTVVRRYRDEIGQLAWAAPQDWMCEPLVREKTGLSVKQHQDLTIENLLHLRALAPDLPIVPVLQGWAPDDYMRHVEAYEDAGVFLNREQLVGLGSVCRRSHLGVAETIVRRLHGAGIRLHGFGLKITAGERMRDAIVSCDSLAWSITARREAPLPGCPHKSCANCMKYALLWRERYLAKMAAPQQMALLA